MAEDSGVERDDEPDPLIGSSVGGYSIEALLGEGGMGRVYRGRRGDGTTVALKMIREDLASDSIFRQRFEREARVAQTVQNAHVVPVLDTGEHEGRPYLAQRFIEGGTLQDKLDRDGRLELDSTLRLCRDVAEGLDALVGEGCVHRDVKPANVMLDLDGSALITDFGLTKDNNATGLTRAGQTVGSLQYMAPEQIRAEDVDAATDIYALGCVVFHCLTGAPPFGAYTGMRVLWAQLQSDPPDPAAMIAGAPAALGPAVLSALAKEPEERPKSAGEYARLLYEAAGQPLPPSASV